MAFGYGMSSTPLQLAQAYTAIANRGEFKALSLLAGGEGPSQRAFSQEHADMLIEMLSTVVAEGGTAANAQIDGYSIAGKTGTVHKNSKRGYEVSKYQSIFAGMAPASNPQLVGVVVVDDPKGQRYFGGAVAAPVFSTFLENALPLLGVAYDKPVDQEQVARR